MPMPLFTDLVGVRRDGAIVMVQERRSWRLIESDGQTKTDLARGTNAISLMLSPEGERFLLIESRWGEVSGLYIVNRHHVADRSQVVARGVLSADWSPDGTLIAATVERSSRIELVVIEVATGRQHELDVEGLAHEPDVIWLDERRIAFRAMQNRTYRWIDRVDGSQGNLVDPAIGYTFDLARSPTDGVLALKWNRRDSGTWLIRGDATERVAASGSQVSSHAWARDGTLLLFDGDRIDRYDPRTRETTHVRRLDLEANTVIVGLHPVPGDRLWVRVQNRTVDLAISVPDRR
jgi:hypothetical protein